MTASEIYIKHWNDNYGTDYGEGKAPHYAVAAMKEYAKQKCLEQRNLCFNNWLEGHDIKGLPSQEAIMLTRAPEPKFD